MAKPKARPKVDPVPKSVNDVWIYALLAAAVFAAYSQMLHFDFVSYDDPDYVTGNPHVQAGLTLAGARWAFSSSFAGNWFPLTWLSHMLDVQLFGLDSGWHHFTNVAIHALSTVLWFVVLRRMTGARWKSALVAFLFGLHPLHVESVAWIAERKDVLSGLFWALTLWAYAAYAARPGRARYALTLALFSLGLMAKPMLVTLPVVLLLLDRWPLGRGTRIIEKVPFFAVSIAASVVTFVVHRSAGAAVPIDLIPLSVRLENSLISYAVYFLKTLWPIGLAVFYPFPYPWGSLVAPAVASGIALATVTIVAVRAFPRRPYLTVGWLWYLVTLLPVIGLIQVGGQARADRYMYVPMIGLAMALVWAVSEALAPFPVIRAGVCATVCSTCLVLTWLQTVYWRDSISLYRHAIAVTSDNYLAHFNLAAVMDARGDAADAVGELRETVRIRPNFAIARAELGQLLTKQGQPAEGVRELQMAATLKPESADTRFKLGSALGALGRIDDAAREFSVGLGLQPDNADAHYNFAIALAQAGRLPEAVREFTAALELRPEDVEARFNLGIALARLGRLDESTVQLSEAVRLKPAFGEARQALDDVTNLKRERGK